ncbi:MAG: ABC transporter ATP-binding protein [Phycisphaerae bacterium]
MKLSQQAAILSHRYDRERPVRSLWFFFAGERKRLAFSLVLYLMKHSPVWLLPIFIERITASVQLGYPEGVTPLLVNVGLVSLLFVQNIPSHMGFTALFSSAKRSMEARLRGALVRRMQELSMGYHDRTQSGKLQAKVLRDVEAIERLVHQLINGLFPGVLGVGFALAVTLYREPLVALFYAVAFPLALVVRGVFRGQIRKRNREFRNRVEQMSGRVSEMIDMIPIARAHAVEGEEINKVDRELQRVRKRGYRLDIINALFACANWVTFNLVRLACLGVTTYLAMRYPQRMGLPDVFMYQGFFEVILRSVMQLMNAYPMIATGFESIYSLGEVLQCPDIESNEGKEALETVRGEFTFQNVSLVYPETQEAAVRDVDLHIEAGESVAFVGESGAGKSSVMALLIGFHRPTTGRLLLDGHDMSELDLRSYRRHLAVVPQTPLLFSGSVRDNIAFGLHEVADETIWQALEAANAAEFVSRMPLELDTKIGERGTTLSGGQRQRIAIARAIIREPRVIILDEATSSLDVYSESLVQEAIERLIAGRTTFVVAHRLSTIRHCGRIVVMKQGEVVEVGSHDELMANEGEYAQLRSLQS